MLRANPSDIIGKRLLTADAGRSSHLLSRVRFRDTVIATSLFLLACWHYLALIDETPFHRDEARWIHRAEYVRELAHPFGVYWDESTWIAQGGPPDAQYRLRAQPPLGSYLMGVGLLLHGRDLNTNGYWIMQLGEEQNVALGNMPPRDDLTAARRTTAIVSALTVAVVYGIGTCLTNRVGGVVAALFLLFHPLVGLYAAFAGSDMLLVFLVASAALAAYRLADRPSWPRVILLGVLLGLGGATKLSPLVVTLPLALLGGIIVMWRVAVDRGESDVVAHTTMASRIESLVVGRSPDRLGWRLVSVPVIAVVTLVACYPYLWRAPVDHTLAMFEFRASAMDVQGMAWPHVAVESRVEAIQRIATRLGEDFTVLGRLGAEGSVRGVELGIAVVGMTVLLFLVARHGLASGHGLALAVLGGQTAITVLGMGVDWARYHLPILLFMAVCLGVAAGSGWKLVASRSDSMKAGQIQGDR